METKIVLVLAMVALSIGCCEGDTNIHGHEMEQLYTKEKLERHLTDEYAPDPIEVARLLAGAIRDDEALEATKGVEIYRLAEMTSPLVFCRHAKFAEFEEWRKLYSGLNGNPYLFKYVDVNFKRLFDICANDIDSVLKREAAINSLEGRHSRTITKYVATTGEETDSQEDTVENFLAAKILNDEEERQLVKGCAALVPRVEQSVSYFMKDDKKASDYLDNLGDTEEALLYKRCKAVNRIFGKQ